MTVHFFTRGDVRSADSRQRAFQVVEQLQKRGLGATIQGPPALLLSTTPWPQKFSLIAELVRSLRSIRKGDIVYLQRTISNKYFFIIMVGYLLLFRRKMIFDFCDPVYVVNPFKTKVLTRMADAVVVSTHAQVIWAKRYCSNVHLIHISLDTAVYKKYTKDYARIADRLIIGWVGTAHNHILNLKIIAGAFPKLLTKTKTLFTFVLVGAFKYQPVYDLFRSIPGLDVRFVDALDYADPESAPQMIQTFDIGIVPHIAMSQWNRDKTSMKILEYMACGVATVADAAGELPYIIQDGVNGCLVHDEGEWVEKLALLLNDRALCERLGRAGQQTIQDHYSFDAIIPRIVQVIHSLS